MSRFYALDPDVSYPGRWFLGEPTSENGDDIDIWLFCNGCRIAQIPKGLKYPVQDEGCILDITLDAFDIPVISGRALSIFSALGDGQVQVFPIEVHKYGKMHLLNICTSVAAINLSESKLDYFPAGHPRAGEIRTIYTLKLREEAVPVGLEIFRIKGFEAQSIISNELKEKMESMGLTGLIYRSV